jgi:hypothetical protein
VEGYPTDLRTAAQVAAAASGVLGDIEARAARVVARLTGENVTIQDDNSRDGIPDIRIEYLDGKVGLVEVVTDVNPHYAETVRQISRQNGAQSSLEIPWELYSEDISRVWFVTVSAQANIRAVKTHLPPLLIKMELGGETFVTQVSRECLLLSASANVNALVSLGVVEVSSRAPRSDGPDAHRNGVILVYPDGIGGPFDVTWEQFTLSIDELLSSKLVQRKVAKLRANECDERHLFIGVSYTSQWALFHALSMDVSSVPLDPPAVPNVVTHVWLMSAGIAGRCLVWFRGEQWCGWTGPTWLDAAYHWKTA